MAVTTKIPGVCLWVFVSFSNRYFSWAEANHQHPVNDIAGAARRIAGHVHPASAVRGHTRVIADADLQVTGSAVFEVGSPGSKV